MSQKNPTTGGKDPNADTLKRLKVSEDAKAAMMKKMQMKNAPTIKEIYYDFDKSFVSTSSANTYTVGNGPISGGYTTGGTSVGNGQSYFVDQFPSYQQAQQILNCAYCLVDNNGIAIRPAETQIDGTLVCGIHAKELLSYIEEED